MLNNNNYIEEEIVFDNNNKKIKYDLVICEIHNEYLHGLTEESDLNISGNYIVAFRANCKLSNHKYINDSETYENIRLSEILTDFVLLYQEKYILKIL